MNVFCVCAKRNRICTHCFILARKISTLCGIKTMMKCFTCITRYLTFDNLAAVIFRTAKHSSTARNTFACVSAFENVNANVVIIDIQFQSFSIAAFISIPNRPNKTNFSVYSRFTRHRSRSTQCPLGIKFRVSCVTRIIQSSSSMFRSGRR